MPHKKSRTEKITIRGLRYNVRHWGKEDAPMVMFLHGWMDCSPTFQFVVDSLKNPWHIVAPDWQGYGESEWLSRPYWHPDYYADLHDLLKHYSLDRPVRLVAHSMGSHIASAYAGICPERVSQLIMLDSLGLKRPMGDDSPTVLGRWLEHVGNGPPLTLYPNFEAFAARLMELDHRLSESRATFLSWNIGRSRADAMVEIACDPWHRIPAPLVYHAEDAMADWMRIKADVLLLVASHGLVKQRFGNDPQEFERRIACFRHLQIGSIPDSGHNVQHDQPELVAAALEEFLRRD